MSEGLAWSTFFLFFVGALWSGEAAAFPAISDTSRPSSTPSVFDPEAGRFLRRYIDPDTYEASRQNWDATQDSSGVLYVANSDGVLVYDGQAWHTLPIPNKMGATTVATDAQGRVFVGASGEFGMIRADSQGRRQYVSLSNRLPEKHKDFDEVQHAEVTDDAVYFQSPQRLFRWRPGTKTVHVWQLSGAEFQHADVVRETLYVNVTGKGLMTVGGDSLRLVPGGEQLADRSVRFLLPHGKEGLLVGAFEGLLLRDGNSFRPFSTEADNLLREAWLYAGLQLQDGTIAIGTIDRGLLLLAPDGALRRHLHPQGNSVTGLYEDREGGLWALLDGGMMRYDLAAPFTVFDRSTGIQGIVLDLARHRDTLYAATMNATYRLQSPGDTLASFTRVSGFGQRTSDTPSWRLLSLGERLFVGTVHGLAQRRADGSVEYLFEGTQVFDLLRSRVDSSRLYAATEGGIRIVDRTETGWEEIGSLDGFSAEARRLAQEDDGTLWVGVAPSGLYRIQASKGRDDVTVDQFGTNHGLPVGEVEPHRWQGEVVFGTGRGVFHFDSSTNHFSLHPAFEWRSMDTRTGRVHLATEGQRHVWGKTGDGPGRWYRKKSTWRWRPGSLYRLRGERVGSMEIEDGGRTLWIGMWEDRVVRYVPGTMGPRDPVSTLVHHVHEYSTDSLLAASGPEASNSARPRVEEGVRITYGVPSLVDPEAITYQYKMKGEEATWSDWTSHTEKIYRSLGPGTYTFAVRARTAYGDTTKPARYTFTVLPPWYRTWEAYGFYLLLALGLVVGVVQWRTRQLRRRQEKLRTAVEERTEEIEKQKEQLADQAERLQELDEAKTRFFANVSHEFRTPLTLILGPVQDLREQVREGLSDESVEQLSVIERNAQRLLRLVDQILGIARMDAGTYRLDARPIDPQTEMEHIVQTFEPLAERGGLTLTLEAESKSNLPSDPEPMYVDREALEHVVGNLLSNAIKFTPEGGTIVVRVTERTEGVDVSVADTGPGIPEKEQSTIFDRFEQSRHPSGSGARPHEGAGIGLAFARDLVDLHGGTIDVESVEGEGTIFTVHFVRGCDHLSETHLTDSFEDAQSPRRDTPTVLEDDRDGRSPRKVFASDSVVDGVSCSAEGGPPSEASSSPSTADDECKRRVLIVEDNADVRQYVRSILKPEFEVLEATNGATGLAVAREELPDVILVDVMMPEVGGHEMTRRLKKHPETKAIPVIMVTARAGTGDEVEGLQVGADDYVTKPFDANVLRQRVGGVIVFQERLRERLREETKTAPASGEGDATGRSEFEQAARDVIREHLTDPAFDVEALAAKMAMSRSTLYRAFKEKTNTTPSTLITEVRMKRAKTLLRNGEGTVTQVAYAVGFNRLSSFSRSFREYAGHPPSTVATSTAEA